MKGRNAAPFVWALNSSYPFPKTTLSQEEELTEAEKQFKAERGGGNYGAGTKEMQVGGCGWWGKGGAG